MDLRETVEGARMHSTSCVSLVPRVHSNAGKGSLILLAGLADQEEGLRVALGPCGLELDVTVEVRGDRRLPPRGDDEDLRDPGCDHLGDDVVNRRGVEQREQFLRDRLGPRQETGTIPACQNDSFSNRVHVHSPW